MTIPRRTLISLPSDVLHEILKLLLLDTPRSPNRTSVLQTCSLLHELGLPLLYRVVDLTEVKDALTLGKYLWTLFSEEGLLKEQVGRGKLVAELRVDRAPWRAGDLAKLMSKSFFRRRSKEETQQEPQSDVGPIVSLPNCSSLTLSSAFVGDDPLSIILTRIAAQLPLRTLEITSYPLFSPGTPACCHLSNPSSFGRRSLPSFFVLPRQQLRRMDFNGSVWFERKSHGGRQLLFWDWSFKILVVKLHLSLPKSGDDSKEVSNLFFEPDSETEKDLFLKDTERVELRVAGPLAEEFDKGFREEFGKREARGLDAFERRIGSLIVFVGEDGEERRLLDQS